MKLEEEQKIFCIGLPRTGSGSLAKALNILGYDVKHGPLHPDKPGWTVWQEFAMGNYRPDIFHRLDGWADTPIWVYWHQLYKAWPGSLFILSNRQESTWLESTKWLHSDREPKDGEHPIVWFTKGASCGTLTYVPERVKWVRTQHLHMVTEFFYGGDGSLSDRLLVLDLEDDDKWGSLCKFLGDPVPDQPYPHKHKKPDDA